jgi:D-alanine-D-alanine ligase
VPADISNTVPDEAVSRTGQTLWQHGFRPKGYLNQWGLALLLLLAGATLLMALARVLAAPGMAVPDFVLLQELRQYGAALNDSLTLEWVPPADRKDVTYLLLLPTVALLITIARLTFGLRVLGYRSVLIAAGFQEIGIVPSLMVMAVVLGIIAMLRPTMRRMRLPMYARVSMILSITACVMVAALFVGPWLRSELIWSLAFFPVIILAMIAESIAGTLDQHNVASAAWRLGWTLAVALLLYALMNSPAVLDIAMRFPELMLTQLVAIVLVSEYLDLRLFQDWQSHGHASAIAGWLGLNFPARKARVAVVRNRWHHGVIARLGPAAPAKTQVGSVQHLVDALRDEGYAVKVFEGDMDLTRELWKFLPPNPRTGAPGGVVLNLAAGIQGHARFSHVPAMLESAGVAYTGPDPIGHARLQDRFVLLSLLQQSGVPVPPFRLLEGQPDTPPLDLAFPLLVRPCNDTEAAAILVKTPDDLGKAVERILRPGQQMLVEHCHAEPEFRVTLLGNGPLECLPLMQVESAGKKRTCPAAIDEALASRIYTCARHAYAIAGCRDYARIDLRLDAAGAPCVVGIHAQEILARKGSVAAMIEAAGLGWGGFAKHIVELAAARNGAEAAGIPPSDNVVPLTRGTVAATGPILDAARPASGGW